MDRAESMSENEEGVNLDYNNNNNDSIEEDQKKEQQLVLDGIKFDQKVKDILNRKEFFMQAPLLDEEELESVFLIGLKENDANLHKSIQLMCMNPIVCFKIIDAISFVL